MPASSDSSSHPPRRRRRRGRRRGSSSSSLSGPDRSRPGRSDFFATASATLTGDAAAPLTVRRDPAAFPFEGLPPSCLIVSHLPPLGQVLCRSPPPSAGGSDFSLLRFGGSSGPGPTLRHCLRSRSLRPACRFFRPWHSCRLLACLAFASALFRSRFLPSSSAFSSPPFTFAVIMARIGGDHPLRALAGRVVASIAGTPARDGSASGAPVPAADAVQSAPAQTAPAASAAPGDGQAAPAQVDAAQPAAGPSVPTPTTGTQFLGPSVPVKSPPSHPPTTSRPPGRRRRSRASRLPIRPRPLRSRPLPPPVPPRLRPSQPLPRQQFKATSARTRCSFS